MSSLTASSLPTSATSRSRCRAATRSGASAIKRAISRAGKTLRLLTGARAVVRWSNDAWQNVHDAETKSSGLPDLFFADLPTADLAVGKVIEFTFHWSESGKWEGKNFFVTIA